ncbi:hypothetical protein DFJ74DRAFT_679844 [Hyaloraphidium curvatum]|nr:hypothetical protein DFJ74DRAFT_679844 [Hyaloraphidium curvatum]
MAPKSAIGEAHDVLNFAEGSPFEILEDVPTFGGTRRNNVYKNAPSSYREIWFSVADAFANADNDREYLVFFGNVSASDHAGAPRRSVTYVEANSTIRFLANAMYDGYGVRKGTRVGIAARNSLEWVLVWWACHMLGAIPVLLNAFLVGNELRYCVELASVEVLFADEERLERLEFWLFDNGVRPKVDEGFRPGSLLSKNGGPVREVIFLPTFPAGAVATTISSRLPSLTPAPTPYEALPSKFPAAAANASWPPANIVPDDGAQILFSSGTTGLPKAVMQTHRAWTTNALIGKNRAARSLLIQRGMVKGDGRIWTLDEKRRAWKELALPEPSAGPLYITRTARDARPQFVVPVPLFHLSGILTLFGATLSGATVTLMFRWSAQFMLKRVLPEQRLTNMNLVPTQAIELFEQPDADWDEAKRSGALSRLASISSGGAAVPPELRTKIDRVLGPAVDMTNIYGATEASGVASNSGPELAMHPASVGSPLPNTQIRITDASGDKELAVGEVGEIWIRGPGVALEYVGNEKATRESFVNGWYKTGDVGRVNENGFLFLLDRSKDMIIRGGENIFSLEIENALYKHPDVVEACVFGIPHPRLQEEPAAVVRLKPGSGETEASLQAFLRDRIAAFKVPAYIRTQLEPVVATASGKQLKRQLREEVAREREERDRKAKAKL